jgi:UDP-glucuronate decarboxylase
VRKSKTNGTSRATDKPVLVCGGAGFIGSHLCERLVRRGERVICLDNFSTSTGDGIAHLQHEPNFELRQLDVATLEPDDVEDVAAIYNLACMASPIHYQRSPLDTLFTSVNGVDTLLRVARRCGARLFQASTSEIYGHPEMHPQKESYWGYVNPMGPRACYDEGKRCAETLCFIYLTEYRVPVRIGRIFNTYGPRMNVEDGRVVVNFIVQALRGEPITMYGDGSQTRSFCYVDDLLDGIERLMADGNRFPGPVNLGNPLEITVAELADRIVDLTSSRSRIVRKPLPIDDPPRRRPDISLAQEMLNWRPRIDLDAGLRATIAYFEQLLRAGEDPLVAAHRQPRSEAGSRPQVQLL